MSETKHEAIRAYYHTLFSAWGRQHWWPAQSRFEVIVGAYLAQNTSWTNVEKALGNLRKAHLLKTFVSFLDERYSGSFKRMFAQPTAKLRDELLALHGVGPETADSIL